LSLGVPESLCFGILGDFFWQSGEPLVKQPHSGECALNEKDMVFESTSDMSG
jgi:hypothetical protein